jgi:hypothetical protein
MSVSFHYRCRDHKARLASVRAHPVLNGIESLEVLDHDAPSGIPRQRTLIVRCLKEVPDSLSAENVRYRLPDRIQVGEQLAVDFFLCVSKAEIPRKPRFVR